MNVRHLFATVLILIGASLSSRAAVAQACPLNGPEVIFYSVTGSTEPERTFEAPVRQASIVGGDAVLGTVRIYMRFAEPLSSSCSAFVYFWRSPSGDPGLATIGMTFDPRESFEELFPPGTVVNMSVGGDGDDDAILLIPTSAYIQSNTRLQRHNVWFSLGRSGPRMPFEVLQKSVALDLRASATSVIGLQPMEIVATLSTRPDPSSPIPLIFTVAPTDAGVFREGASMRSSVVRSIDPGISPSSARVYFVGRESEQQPVTVTVTARTAGGPTIHNNYQAPAERTVTFTVMPEPRPCTPEASLRVVPGALELIVTNIGQTTCSNLRIQAMHDARAIRDTITSLPPASPTASGGKVTPPTPVTPLTTSPITLPTTRAWVRRYVLEPIDMGQPSRIPAGRMSTRVVSRMTVYWEGAGRSTVPLASLDITAADAAILNQR